MWLQGFRSGAGKYASGATTQTDLRKYRPISISSQQVTRGPATWWTIIALALINVGVATTIVILMGASSLPVWVGLVLVTIGVAAALVAVGQWRQYLAALQQR